MALRESLEKQGNWLFRYRSYLPLLLIPLLPFAFNSGRPLVQSLPAAVNSLWTVFCILISFAGLALRAATVGFVPEGTSGRNAASQRADYLNTTGIYSLLRHPLYLSNFLIFFGVMLYPRSGWFIVLGVVAFWIYYERIMFAEEEFLRGKFGSAYLEWSQHTPAFFPNFKNWQRPNLSFSLRTVLKREYSGFFAIIAAFTALKLLQDLIIYRRWHPETAWVVFFIFGAVVYLSLRTMKKKTRWLNVEGR